MPDRDKVISELELAASLAWNSDEGQREIMDADDAMTVDRAILDALALLKDQEHARCGNCQFRDFGENEVDSWDRCKLHRRNTSPDEYCLWYAERAGEVDGKDD